MNLFMLISMLVLSLVASLILPSANSIRLLDIQKKYSSDHVFFDVRRYGAKGDGKTDDSNAFLTAWNGACSSNRPSTVYVPNQTFLLNPVIFQGPCSNNDITMQVNGQLIASRDDSLYGGNNEDHWLHFWDVNDLTVEGGGVIDGQGASWWPKDNKNHPNLEGPTSLRFTGSTNTILRNITSINSKMFHTAFVSCNNVQVEGLTIDAPGDSPNTDGIHLQDSSNVRIRRTDVRTGDDCISIGSGSFNVDIHGIRCGPGHGISVGSLGEDHSIATVKNITVREVSFVGTQNGVRIKTWPGGSGFAQDITFENIKMTNVQNPIIIDQYYFSDYTLDKGESGVKISNVIYKNITGTSDSQVAINLLCSGSVLCNGIQIEDVKLVYKNGDGEAEFVCNNAAVTAIDVGLSANTTNCLIN